MRYYRIHTSDIAYITQQPRGIFTAIGKLADAGILSEDETKEYWRNREYFEKALPVPPFYDEGNTDKAITWFKDTPEGNRIYSEMTFYREMARKYGTQLFISECDEIPGEIIYEDNYQIAVKNQRIDVKIITKKLRSDQKMIIRFAKETELVRVNELRKQVNNLHVEGKPEVFKAGFNDELRDYIYTIWNDPKQEIVVADSDGTICGFAVIHHIVKPETPFMYERDFMDVDEFCVDKEYRRRGAASEMITFIRNYAKEKGFNRIELNMWEFNQDALAFYEAVGFKTYRRYMEMMV